MWVIGMAGTTVIADITWVSGPTPATAEVFPNLTGPVTPGAVTKILLDLSVDLDTATYPAVWALKPGYVDTPTELLAVTSANSGAWNNGTRAASDYQNQGLIYDCDGLASGGAALPSAV